MSLKTQNIYTFLCFHISTHSNKILNALENFTQICELILHIMCKLLLHKYVLNDRNEHKFCKIILIKCVISNKTYLCKIFLHIFLQCKEKIFDIKLLFRHFFNFFSFQMYKLIIFFSLIYSQLATIWHR